MEGWLYFLGGWGCKCYFKEGFFQYLGGVFGVVSVGVWKGSRRGSLGVGGVWVVVDKKSPHRSHGGGVWLLWGRGFLFVVGLLEVGFNSY